MADCPQRSPRKLQPAHTREREENLLLSSENSFSFGRSPWHRAHAQLPETWWRASSTVCVSILLYFYSILLCSFFLFLFFFCLVPSSHRLQIIWNFPSAAQESPQGSFSTLDSQTNYHFPFADIFGTAFSRERGASCSCSRFRVQ